MSEKIYPFAVSQDSRKLLTLMLTVILLANWIPQFDRQAQLYLTDTIASNATVFGIVRSLNAAISVIQTAEVGVGIASIGPGEALDPVNDLVERFAGVLLVTLTALGISQVLLLLTTSLIMKIALSILIGISLVSLWWKPGLATAVMRFFFALLILRFIFVAQVSFVWLFDWLYFNSTGQEAMSVLDGIAQTYQSLQDTISNLNLRDRLFGDNQVIVEEDTLSETITTNVVTLIVGMLFKSIIIPVGTLWIGLRGITGVLAGFNTQLVAVR